MKRIVIPNSQVIQPAAAPETEDQYTWVMVGRDQHGRLITETAQVIGWDISRDGDTMVRGYRDADGRWIITNVEHMPQPQGEC